MAGALVTTNLLQTAASMTMSALRERIVLARVANREVEGDLSAGARKNATVNVSIPAAITARAITPDVVPPAVTAVTPTSVPVTLSDWYEGPFAVDDKAIMQIGAGVVPWQLKEAAKAVANAIENSLWTKCKGFYSFVGTPGTAPFGTGLDEYLDALAIADTLLMDPENRHVILNPVAYTNALGLAQIQNAAWRGNSSTIDSGRIGAILGAIWDQSQLTPLHTAGTWTNAGTASGTNAAGQATVNLTGGTGSILVGDIVTFAGDTQTYSVLTATGTAPTTAITVAPNLVTAKSASEVVTVKATHRMNLLIQPNALAFACPLMAEAAQTASARANTAPVVDEESGLALTLKVSDQYFQTQWSVSALWGSALVRNQFGVRIAG